MRGARAGIRNADNLALKKENEELLRANEDWNRRFEGKERDLAQQQKARLPTPSQYQRASLAVVAPAF